MSTGTDFRLPHRLIETYKSYKEGTKTIVEYLCQNTLPPIPAIERYPLSLLVRLAKNIKARNIVISRDLDATLRDTIALRKRMTTAFHTHAFVTHNDLSNQCHEKFTATLQTIHDILVNNVSKVSHKQSKNIRKAIAKEAEEVFQSEASQNRFEALNSLVEEQVPNSCESDQAACNDYFSGFKTKSVKSTEETGILRDDDLAEDIDMLLELAVSNI